MIGLKVKSTPLTLLADHCTSSMVENTQGKCEIFVIEIRDSHKERTAEIAIDAPATILVRMSTHVALAYRAYVRIMRTTTGTRNVRIIGSV